MRARGAVNVKGFCHLSQLMQREILHCWGSTSVFRCYANLDPFVVQIKVDFPPPPLHHNALSGTDVTSILYSSNNINGDGWQDHYLVPAPVWQTYDKLYQTPERSHRYHTPQTAAVATVQHIHSTSQILFVWYGGAKSLCLKGLAILLADSSLKVTFESLKVLEWLRRS